MGKYITKLAIEAVVVGLLTVVVGSLVGGIISATSWYPRPVLPKECRNYNKFFVMEFTLFLTGVLIHLFCEFAGVNAWYSKNGAAALKKKV